jgi:hypothetical protein
MKTLSSALLTIVLFLNAGGLPIPGRLLSTYDAYPIGKGAVRVSSNG